MEVARLAARTRGARRPAAQLHRRRRLRAPHPGAGLGARDARRDLQCLHAVPGRGEPGHAADHVRVPVHDRGPDGARRVERVALRRRLGARRGLPDGRARAPALEVRAHPGAGDASIPTWRRVARAITGGQGLRLEHAAVRSGDGPHRRGCSPPFAGEDVTALVIPQPNFFGQLEDVDALTRWARANGALVIAAVNPVSLALVDAAGEWGDGGADIAVGDAQPSAFRCPPAVPTSGSWPAGWSTCARCPGASRAAPWIPRASPASR